MIFPLKPSFILICQLAMFHYRRQWNIARSPIYNPIKHIVEIISSPMIYSLYPHCNISPYGYGSKMSSSKNGWLKLYSNLWSSLQFDPSQSGGFHKWMFYIGNSWQNWWFGGHLWRYSDFRKRAYGSERSVLVQYVSASLHYVIPIPEGLPTVFATAMPRLRAPSGAQAAAADPCSPARSPHLASGDLPCGLRQQQSIDKCINR